MAVTYVFMFFLAAFGASLAAVSARSSFSVNLIPIAKRDQSVNVSQIFARNYLRYGGRLIHTAETASVLASPEFLITVSVGASTLQLSVDTGSSDLWVFSAQLSQDQRKGHNAYKPSVYATSSEKTWKIQYADGSSASGGLSYDVVGIEGIWVMQQAVEVATDVSDDLTHEIGFDGVIGLGFRNLNRVRPQRENTFFENAKSNLQLPLFAVNFKQNGLGSCDFGYINGSNYVGELSYVDVDSSRGHWSFKVTSYGLGNGQNVNDQLMGVIDTGASLMFLSDLVVQKYYSQVLGAENQVESGGWVVPCSSVLPPLTIIVDGYEAVIPGDLLKLEPIVQNNSQCYGGIQSNLKASVAVFGQVFLRSHYVVFDDRGPRLGFARQSRGDVIEGQSNAVS